MANPTKTFPELLQSAGFLQLPAAHDALSARMIERAGFSGAFVSGFGIAGCQFGLPDLGLASFGEMAGAARYIAEAIDLPVLMDADDGYGDVKNVTRAVRSYERMGMAGLILEDQASPKKCGHTAEAKRLVSTEEFSAKIFAATAERQRSDFFIVARTDARGVEGLDAAIARGQRYIASGADALFVEAPASIEELRIIGSAFDVPLLVNAAEGGKTPILTPAQYRELGFAIGIYPGTLMPRMIALFEETLACLKQGIFPDDAQSFPAFSKVTEIMGMKEWIKVESCTDSWLRKLTAGR